MCEFSRISQETHTRDLYPTSSYPLETLMKAPIGHPAIQTAIIARGAVTA